ncbi:MAG TPA: UDP-N-acetylmuramoyl-L-alanyl-D-glutamate--2,6-diaminopimelate ligase [Bacilli bacterium]
MRLQDLSELLLVSRLAGDSQTQITGIQTDSRKVQPGDLFICVPGLVFDGHDFAADAAANGAAALVVERDVAVGLPKLFVKDCRYAMAVIASHFYGYPGREMRLIGVTGTNGKTTTTYLIEQILRQNGFRTGLMGTIRMKIGNHFYNADRTTQDVVELQQNLRLMADEKTDYCVMEVSSHALELGRVKGLRYRSAVFTNLTQDHLDYHLTMENYKAAKGLLFSRLGNEFEPDLARACYAVLNADDPASAEYARMTSAQTVTYGVDNDADVKASNVKITANGTSFYVSTFAGTAEMNIKLIGKFNVYNCLAAFAACLAERIPFAQIKHSLETAQNVAGRMEPVQAGQDFLVVVDYAHTPDGLQNALHAIRQFAAGRIITVFGCGGDRDRTKRPIMGKIAGQMSDYVIVTSDNPRTEEPLQILRDIAPGIEASGIGKDCCEMIVSRKEAIRQAVRLASKGDVVLIAGKGHETYQLINGVAYEFDDRLAAIEAIRSL